MTTTQDDGTAVHNIDASLMQHAVPVSSLRTHPDNARKGDVRLVAESLRRFGQLKPVVAHQYEGDERGPVIVAGNHTFLGATEENGWTHIAAVYPEITDEQADQFLLMDNRASDTATYDDAKLVELLEQHSEAGTLEGTGFNVDDVDDLIAALGREAEEQETDADFIEDPSETAAGYEGREEGKLREMIIPVPTEDFDEFRELAARMKVLFEEDTAAVALLMAMREVDGRARALGE